MGRAFEYRRASKEKRWDKMSKVFPKLAKAITIAAKEGAPEPENNPKLRLAIMNAKAQNMPKDNIESAIKRAAGKDGTEITEITYEGKGPHGTMFFIECATDNTNRSVVNLRTYFNKGGGQLLDTGALQFLFDRRSVVEFELAEDQNLEEVELGLMDHGLEELESNENVHYAYADVKDFGRLSRGAEELGVQIRKASLQRMPTSPVELSEEQMEEVEKLMDKIEDDEDVQAVFTNIA